MVDVAALGWVEEGLALRRSGARAGDAIVVTGALGASGAGLQVLLHGLGSEDAPSVKEALSAHLTPRPRVEEGRRIAATRLATAMMDLSDGLAMDLPRLCVESGLGRGCGGSASPFAPACAARGAAGPGGCVAGDDGRGGLRTAVHLSSGGGVADCGRVVPS